ncbi:sigma-54 dependent transcriptional regulator [Polynucleobacter sp. UK-FUSCHL-C3]|uniref:Sigma-54 dependent transcriptional regulator n=1 Tax=Polynucleobacter sp. UK-FUSCHL-C3 TaxID=2955208 RepID=A0AAU8A0Z5_9BURK
MMTPTNTDFPVILVEDDEDLREAIAVTLRLNHIDFVTHQRAESVLPLLQPGLKTVLITDYRLPGMNGLDLLKIALKEIPDLPVIVMTAFADAKLAVEALKAGARDFLIKPFVPDQLIEIISRYRPPNLPHETSTAIQTSVASPPKLVADQQKLSPAIIAVDPAMINTLARCERVAKTDTSVLITGGSGVGKEIIAHHIHLTSKRASGPYVALNCAAIPDTLLESILFGHEKGSFTGATKSQSGKFEQADGGTLFLDEIGEMPASLQAKLLRVLQDKMVERLGSAEPIKADVRIIAATNRNLEEQVQAGRFREDLYFRLAVFPIHIPELHKRAGDILPLADFFLKRYRLNIGRDDLVLGPSALEMLPQYNWPGNVRELENIIQRAVLLCDGDEIGAEHLEIHSQKPPNESASSHSLRENPQNGTNIASNLTSTQGSSANDMNSVEREHILKVLAQVGGNRSKAVQILGISERALRYKLKSYKEAGFEVDK